MCCYYMLRVCGCVFCLFLLCLYICVCEYLQIPKVHCGSAVRFGRALPGYPITTHYLYAFLLYLDCYLCGGITNQNPKTSKQIVIHMVNTWLTQTMQRQNPKLIFYQVHVLCSVSRLFVSAYAHVYFKTNSTNFHVYCGSTFEPGASRIPYYCTSICVRC